jgi:hypothetical protein
MSEVFADTAFYVALLNPRDSLHAVATQWSARQSQPVVTTEFILLEVANFLKFPADRARFCALA